MHRRLEQFGIVVILVVSTSGLIPLLSGASAGSETGTGAAHVFWLPVYAILGILLLPHLRLVPAYALRSALPLAVVAWALASSAWSVAGSHTLTAALGLLLTTVLGIVLAERYEMTDLVGLLAIALGVVVLLSLVFAVVFPRYGLDPVRGDSWRGIFLTKNELGRIALLAVLVLTIRGLASSSRRTLTYACAAVGVVCIVESGSRSALLIGCLVAGTAAGVRCMQFEWRARVASLCFLTLAYSVGLLLLMPQLSMFISSDGTDATLTGRTVIWSAVLTAIHAHPISGYGFAGFWIPGGGGERIWSELGPVAHAHDGYLETWLELGGVGLVLVIALIAKTIFYGFSIAVRGESRARAFPLLFMAFLIGYNITESTLVARESIYWLLLVIVSHQVTYERRAMTSHRVAPSALALQRFPQIVRPLR